MSDPYEPANELDRENASYESVRANEEELALGEDTEAETDLDLRQPSEKEIERGYLEVALGNSIKDCMVFMGPGELATHITTSIEDSEYLAQTIRQMQANLDGRTEKLPF